MEIPVHEPEKNPLLSILSCSRSFRVVRGQLFGFFSFLVFFQQFLMVKVLRDPAVFY